MIPLEELAYFLPYSLQFQGENALTIRKYTEEMTIENIMDVSECDYLKPAVYPLTMLTEEIEYNGEKFVPADRFGVSDNFLFTYILKGEFPIQKLSLDSVQHLIKWNFDGFGWLDQEKAVDKSKLK